MNMDQAQLRAASEDDLDECLAFLFSQMAQLLVEMAARAGSDKSLMIRTDDFPVIASIKTTIFSAAGADE